MASQVPTAAAWDRTLTLLRREKDAIAVYVGPEDKAPDSAILDKFSVVIYTDGPITPEAKEIIAQMFVKGYKILFVGNSEKLDADTKTFLWRILQIK